MQPDRSDANGAESFWRKLGAAEPLVLILGLALLYFGVFAQSSSLDAVLGALDVRQWSVFVSTTVVATVLFAIYWIRVWRRDAQEPLDEDDLFCAKRLLLASSVVLAELWGGAVLSGTEFPRYAWFQLRQLFAYGIYTNVALWIILGIALLVAGTAFVVVRWLVAFLNNRYV